MTHTEPEGSTQGNPLVSVEVLRYDKRSKSENTGIVPTEMELILEYTQQGISHEVSGDHAVYYSSEVGVKLGHNLVRDIFVDICSKVGIMVRKEAPMGFLFEDGKDLRPADLLLFNLLQGKDTCLDVTDISPFAGTGVNSWAPGLALHNAVEKKRRKYISVCADNGYKFIPFAFSMFGEVDKDFLDTLSRIKSLSISHSNNVKSGAFIFHRVNLCIQKGVGAQLVSRLPSNFL
nr:hypothetical protein [Tanacetum cinerariifolium]